MEQYANYVRQGENRSQVVGSTEIQVQLSIWIFSLDFILTPLRRQGLQADLSPLRQPRRHPADSSSPLHARRQPHRLLHQQLSNRRAPLPRQQSHRLVRENARPQHQIRRLPRRPSSKRDGLFEAKADGGDADAGAAALLE